MTQSFSITKSDIRALANTQSFERGEDYFHDDSVFDLIRRGNDFTAKVEGSGYDPYQIQVTIVNDNIVATSCTCPYDWGGICKHIVATLLAIINEPETIVEKPELSTLLAELTADQLRQILIGLADEGPAFAEAIEREMTWLQEQPVTVDAPKSETISVSVDINAVRREIDKDFRLAGKGDPFEHGYYDEYAALEISPDEILQPHLEKVLALLDAGDVETAETLIIVIINSYIDGLSELEEWVYEYNEDVLIEANLTMGAVLAEVLLTPDLEPDEQEEWLAQIANWEDGLGDLDIANTAVEQGWSYPPLVSAMKGNITEKGAWEEEAPYYADELALARLHVLARQGRTQEYINLAEAEGRIDLAINMRAQSGDIDKAVTDAKTYLLYPRKVLSLAEILVAKGEMEAAFEVAESGLSLEENVGKVELARWTREQAVAAGKHDLALQAAQTAFTSSYSLADYKVVQELAGERWQTIKPKLLEQLQQGYPSTLKIDIYLYENMLDEAMAVLDNSNFAHEHDLKRVIEATRERRPDWGIQKSKRKAEVIMDAGSSGSYDTAVSWLKIARDIYQQHQRQQEWEAYLDSLLDTHQRKYKLAPMLRNIRN